MDFTAYADWQKVLAGEFFGPETDGHPVVLYVNDREAEVLQGRAGLEVPLRDAVRSVILRHEGRPYLAVEEYATNRASGGAVPAVLPLLACSVIAATRMANDGYRRANNYHDHFSELLADQADVLNSSHYKAVAAMWQQLATWQHESDTFKGLCTIPSPADIPHHQARIGFALSQAVVRGTDRQLLPQYFEVMRNRNPAAWPLPGEVLANGVELWDHARQFSPAFQKALDHRDLRPLVVRLLGGLANVWDGSPDYVPSGTPRGQLLVRYENRRLGWLAKFGRPGAPEYRLSSGVVLRQLGDTEYYSVDGLELPSDRVLRSGIQLVGDGVAVSRAASSLVLLRQNESLDCMTSVDRFVPGEQHMIFAAPDAVDDVEKILRKAASPGSSREAGRLTWMPQGWALHRNVVFDDAVTLRRAIRDVQGAVLAVQPLPQYQAYLEGGLLLAPKLSKSLYLAGGGEPELVLPDGASGQATLDGKPQDPPFRPRGLPIPLWPCGLEHGAHVLEAEDQVLTFRTSDRAPDLPEAQEPFGFPTDGTRAEAFASVPTTGDLIRGAAAGSAGERAVPRVLLCRKGAVETLFVSSDGRAWRIAEPDTPAWWQRLEQAPSGYRFEVDLRVGGWLLQLRQGKWQAEAAQPEAPSFTPGPQHGTWAEAVLEAGGAGSGPLWEAFVDKAREVAQ
ncbi:hypothetical protein ACIQ6K_24650 [Streptomyces sp. NPDC096354]|uniref:hypothetical protein n=1 Tax=Streptomyces sp. NPDC096354 TaxID=3366088 RepID=UPI0038021EF3